MTNTHLLLIPALCCFVLTACGTKYAAGPSVALPRPVQPPVTPPPPIAPEEIPMQENSSTTVIRPTKKADRKQLRSLPAALSLRSQAQIAAKDGNHTRAIGLLERAIRISPSDPATFQALAESHLAMDRPAQALELVRRALNLNPSIEQRMALDTLTHRCEAQL